MHLKELQEYSYWHYRRHQCRADKVVLEKRHKNEPRKCHFADTDESRYLVGNVDEKDLIKIRIELLQKKLSVDTPITPFDAFNLSTGAFLAASANILTYLIILLQFKMSQSGTEADRLENLAQNTEE